jgi:poly(3-hydroxybutyrate) depolymerase
MTKHSSCRLGVTPDRRCSPGAYWSGLTRTVLCSARFRPSAAGGIPRAVQHSTAIQYGLSPGQLGKTVVIDHLVPVGIGGSGDIANLFPLGRTATGYALKQKLDAKLRTLVCAGQMGLRSAQSAIAANWQALYQKVFAAAPAATPAPLGGTGGKGMDVGLSAIQHIDVGGFTRAYKTYRPSSLQDGAAKGGVPLVMFLPDAAGTSCFPKASYDALVDCDLGTSASSGGGEIPLSLWPAEADKVGAIVVYPDEIPSTCVNAPRASSLCNPVWGGSTGNEATFVNKVLNEVETSQARGANIDPSRVYLTGFYAGATIAELFACQEPPGGRAVFNNDYSGSADAFKGFGIELSGQLGVAPANRVYKPCSWPSGPGRPTIQITSKGDDLFMYDDATFRGTGGIGSGLYCPAMSDGSPCLVKASASAADYSSHYGCNTTPVSSVVSTPVYTSYTQSDYTGCQSGAYEWISLGTAQSNAPPHTMPAVDRMINAPDLIWSFWSRNR